MRFAKLGAKVVVIGRRPEPLLEVRSEIESAGGRALPIPTDVRNFDAVQSAVDKAVSVFGSLDILVNNAAGNFIAPTAELSPNGWRTVIDIDLNGTFHCCKAGFASLRDSRFGGRIISIVTDKARTGWPGCAHAAAAKAGIISLSRSLAQEWGPFGIRTNTVAPGPIEGTEGGQPSVRPERSRGSRAFDYSARPVRRGGRYRERLHFSCLTRRRFRQRMRSGGRRRPSLAVAKHTG